MRTKKIDLLAPHQAIERIAVRQRDSRSTAEIGEGRSGFAKELGLFIAIESPASRA